MTEGELITIGFNAVGLLGAGVWFLIQRTSDFKNIQKDISDRFAVEKLARTEALNAAVTDRDVQIDKIRRDWTDSQDEQDKSHAELGFSLRRHIEGVSSKMHENEIWNRDNFVRKQELDSVRSDIKDLGALMQTLISGVSKEFKEDMRNLESKISERN